MIFYMKLKRFKEKNPKKLGIILFTISCILLISGVILYRTFAIFQVNETQNMIEGNIQDEGDIRFMVYIDDVLQKDVPSKESGYSLDTSTSYCDNGDLISWDDENWEVRLKNISTTKTKCYLKFKQIYKEGILNEAIPDLMNGRLVPVVILANESPSDVNYVGGSKGGKVEKADITDTNDPWYSYTNKKWANAVILKNGKTDTYKVGDEILESDIESYFVWIPRYSYQLQNSEDIFNSYSGATLLGNFTNVANVYEEMKKTNQVGNKAKDNGFYIEFGSKEKDTRTEGYIIHPAFTAFDSNGFWAGKFETGYNQNNDGSVMPPNADSWSTSDAQQNTIDSTKVIIKPNVYSWRGIQIANAFYTSYEYKRELESHMMKNTEWGAVAYLTNSQYGRCDSSNKNCSEVRINNNSNYITGYSAKEEPLVGAPVYNSTDSTTLNQDGENGFNYNNHTSQESSTTGNYTGIYDMSGGAWEYVMGVMQGKDDNSKTPASGPNSINNSGFKGPYSSCIENGGLDNCNEDIQNTTGREWPSSKYYDLYDYKTSEENYNRGILGDATKEMGPFYRVSYNNATARPIGSYNADFARFINSGAPWFERGVTYTDGTNAGITAFSYYTGVALNSNTFRIILTP